MMTILIFTHSFMDNNIDRIGSHEYVPSDQDILYARVQTTGIINVALKIKDMSFK